MIFVSLGTQDKPFKRLIDYCENLNLDEEIIVQVGLTEYQSDKLKIKYFLSADEFNQYINDARIVITHGGVGTIINALKKHKKIIACPRLAKYHEHHNDHQLEIIEEFSKDGYLKALGENDDLLALIKSMDDFIPKEYISNTNNFIQKLDDYLSNL